MKVKVSSFLMYIFTKEKTLSLSEHVPEFPEEKERELLRAVSCLQLERKKATQCFHLVHCTTVYNVYVCLAPEKDCL